MDSKSKHVLRCGLVVNAQVPWLGASPDCLLYDPSEKKPYSIGGGEVSIL